MVDKIFGMLSQLAIVESWMNVQHSHFNPVSWFTDIPPVFLQNGLKRFKNFQLYLSMLEVSLL